MAWLPIPIIAGVPAYRLGYPRIIPPKTSGRSLQQPLQRDCSNHEHVRLRGKKEQRRWSHEDRLTSKTNRCWMRQINIFTKSEVQVAAYQLLSAAVYDMLTASPWPFTLKPKVISASYTWHGQSCFVLDSEADSAHSEGRRTDRRPPAIRNVASSKEGCIKVKERIVLSEIHLRTTGRHLSMGSHSIICHPTEVPSPQPGRLVLDLSTP